MGENTAEHQLDIGSLENVALPQEEK